MEGAWRAAARSRRARRDGAQDARRAICAGTAAYSGRQDTVERVVPDDPDHRRAGRDRSGAAWPFDDGRSADECAVDCARHSGDFHTDADGRPPIGAAAHGRPWPGCSPSRRRHSRCPESDVTRTDMPTTSTATSIALSDTKLFRQAAYIDGAWVEPRSGSGINVDNPATGEVIGVVPKLGAAETRTAVTAA